MPLTPIAARLAATRRRATAQGQNPHEPTSTQTPAEAVTRPAGVEDDSESASSASEDDEDEDDGEEQDDEEEDDRIEYISLSDGKTTFSSLDELLAQDKEHGINLLDLIKRYVPNDDVYGIIRLVNYLRAHRGVPAGAGSSLWSEDEQDEYLRPAILDDALLLAADELLEKASGPTQQEGQELSKAPLSASGASDPSRIKELEDQLAAVTKQFESYRAAVAATLDKRWDEADGSKASQESNARAAEKQAVGDASYFESYSFTDIHETMIRDHIRTDAYRDYIYDFKHQFKDKVVLDVGCGSGILSFMAARAGARRVYAVDNAAPILAKASQIAAANDLSKVVKFIQGKIEEVEIPEKVDLIISEWMGYSLLYESMLDSVISARDRFLKPGGQVQPSNLRLHIAAVCDDELIADRIGFWGNVYGFDMRAMAHEVYDEVLIRTLDEKTLLTDGAVFKQLDIATVQRSDLEFESSVEMTATKDGKVHAFVLWFDTIFLADEAVRSAGKLPLKITNDMGVSFTTGPHGHPTHWQSAVLLVEKGQELSESAVLRATVDYRRRQSDSRALNICVKWAVGDGKERRQEWSLQ